MLKLLRFTNIPKIISFVFPTEKCYYEINPLMNMIINLKPHIAISKIYEWKQQKKNPIKIQKYLKNYGLKEKSDYSIPCWPNSN